MDSILRYLTPTIDRNLEPFDKFFSDSVMQIALWYICWKIPVKIDSRGIQDRHIRKTLWFAGDDFDPFYKFLYGCLDPYGCPYGGEYSKIRPQPPSPKPYDPIEDYREEYIKSERKPVVVNPKKMQKDLIYLNPDFGNGMFIKPHQEIGLQFLWREIITGVDGCLLAQTMGLGKTMQVIALIVTLAEAVDSRRENISLQVPQELHERRTLILCPPALVENWYEELDRWIPDSCEYIIGDVHTVTASMDVEERIEEIEEWSKGPGILVMGYSTFKDLINNNVGIRVARHDQFKKILTQRPSLIIADEAHGFKNPQSVINKAMNEFKSKKRIALTGSPLSNHLEEYFTIIDWVAPKFLGSLHDFRISYDIPIQQGLYQDSDDVLYSEAKMKLKALELEMDLKVHRANADVLFNDLPGKTEFIIKVRLVGLLPL